MPKIIELSGVVGYDITAKGLKNRLDKNQMNIIKVDSVGGSVFEGVRLFNAIGDFKKAGGKIKMELGAISASAASFFPLAAGFENITVRKNTTYMIHKAWTIALGNSDDMKLEMEILDGLDRILAKEYSKLTGKSIEDTLEDMKNELWLIGSDAIIEAGFAAGVSEYDVEEESEEEEPVGKAEIVAMIQNAKDTLREVAESEDLNKWAAKVREPEASAEGQYQMFKTAPHGADVENTTNKEGNMDLKELFAQNPDAEAEHKALIETAKAEAVKTALAEDRNRGADIFTLYGTGEMAMEAYKEGKDIGALAVEEKRAEIEARKKAEADKPADPGISADGQVPKKPETEEKSAAEKAVDGAIDALVKKEAK